MSKKTTTKSPTTKKGAPKATKPPKKRPQPQANDFESVARRLGADEDKDRFEAKLKKIATATK